MNSKKTFLFYLFLFLVLTFLTTPFVNAGFFDTIKSKITGRATSQPVSLNISVSGSSPIIPSVGSVAAVTLLENTTTTFTINFTAYDADGFSNLKTVAVANVSKSGSTTRYNSTCSQISTFASNYSNYSCTLTMWYFDDYGTWNIGLAVNDTSNAQGFNTTTTFTINQLTAFISGPGSLTFSGISPGAVNSTASNDPLLLNNTGNDPISAGSIEINATNLVGETDNTKALYAANFSVGIVTGSNAECGLNTNQSNFLNRSVYVQTINASLPNGNFSVNDGSTGQEQLYVCLRLAGSELSTQSYSTSNQGAWTIRIS